MGEVRAGGRSQAEFCFNSQPYVEASASRAGRLPAAVADILAILVLPLLGACCARSTESLRATCSSGRILALCRCYAHRVSWRLRAGAGPGRRGHRRHSLPGHRHGVLGLAVLLSHSGILLRRWTAARPRRHACAAARHARRAARLALRQPAPSIPAARWSSATTAARRSGARRWPQQQLARAHCRGAVPRPPARGRRPGRNCAIPQSFCTASPPSPCRMWCSCIIPRWMRSITRRNGSCWRSCWPIRRASGWPSTFPPTCRTMLRARTGGCKLVPVARTISSPPAMLVKRGFDILVAPLLLALSPRCWRRCARWCA